MMQADNTVPPSASMAAKDGHPSETGMKVFFDTEFIDDGRTIELISIGMIREDGETYYAESIDCDLRRASPWVERNVIPHLVGGCVRLPRKEIAREALAFVGSKPEFWAYYADYDWVALCQLYGTMMQLPKSWPMYCRDLKQLCDSLGNPRLPKMTTTAHHALNDAQWAQNAYNWLVAQTIPLPVQTPESPDGNERVSGTNGLKEV